MRAKRFFYIAAGLFLLMAAYSLGAARVQGQISTGRFVGITQAQSYDSVGNLQFVAIAVAESGDWYYQVSMPGHWPNVPWQRGGNIGGGSVGVDGATWSGSKSAYRK
jgi:hypothetical protein